MAQLVRVRRLAARQAPCEGLFALLVPSYVQLCVPRQLRGETATTLLANQQCCRHMQQTEISS